MWSSGANFSIAEFLGREGVALSLIHFHSSAAAYQMVESVVKLKVTW